MLTRINILNKLFICSFLFFSLALNPVKAESMIASFKIGNGQYSVNGEVKNDTAPYIKDGRTYLPVRYVAYALGIGDNSIYWDQDTQTAFLAQNSEILSIKVGEHYLRIGDRQIYLDAPAEIKDGRTMLPVRAVSEAFGCTVEWNEMNREIYIKL